MKKKVDESWRRLPWRDYIDERFLAGFDIAGNQVVVLPPYSGPSQCGKADVFLVLPYDLKRTKHPSDLIGYPTIGIRRSGDEPIQGDLFK